MFKKLAVMLVVSLALNLAALSSQRAEASPISVQQEGIKFPKKLVCTHGPEAEKSVIYTRLGAITQASQLPQADHSTVLWSSESENAEKPKHDEVAIGWIGDYYQATVD